MTKAIASADVAVMNGNGHVETDAGKASVVSREITAEDFLLVFAEETIEYQMNNGTHVMLRSLTRPEVLGLVKQYKGNEADMPIGALKLSLVAPQLAPEQWATVEKGKAGPLFKLGTVVMRLSGMVDDDKALGEDGASS